MPIMKTESSYIKSIHPVQYVEAQKKEDLQAIIPKMENELANGSFFTPSLDYADADIKYMPHLVAVANKKEGQNLSFIITPDKLPCYIDESISNGLDYFRCIINMGGTGIHFAAADFKLIDDKLSIFFLEPASLKNTAPAILSFRVVSALSRATEIIPEFNLCIAVMNIQKSNSECGLFSLGLAKKLFSERETLNLIHKKNSSGELPNGMKTELFEGDELDRILPATFYKHAQSKTRLESYLAANANGNSLPVNKKGELLLERAERFMMPIREKNISYSIHQKRIIEYSRILTLQTDKPIK